MRPRVTVMTGGSQFTATARHPDGVRQNTAARTGVRQRQDVRNQRKVAFSERPLILME